ncbi:MAG: SH3 domain-containing protein [Pseudomonadota bacterium]
MIGLKCLLTAFFVMCASAASSEPFPALYDVIDVAQNDVLNIREEPTASSRIVGALSPNAVGVEVVRLDATRRWARVRTFDGMGWASTRFLAQIPQQGEGFGQGLTCAGTEPFWDLNYLPFAPSVFTILGEPLGQFDLPFPRRAEGRPNVYGITGPGTDADLFGILRREMCSDGMSDIEYGLTLDVILHGQDDLIFTGCCSLGAR